MNNFKNVANKDKRSNYSNQNKNNELNKIIITSKDDFNFLTFRGSIYHDLDNDPNYHVSNAKEYSLVFNGDIFHNNNNYNPQNQNILGNNFNNVNTNISRANLNYNLNNINNNIYYNNNIRQRARAFSQKTHNNSNLMLNKYNFNPNYNINCYNQNLQNNNINQINLNKFNGQNNLQMNNFRNNQNNQYKSSFPNNPKNIQYPANIQNINFQNKVKNYEMNQIDKYLKIFDVDKNKIENNINIDSYNKLKINNNLINNNQNEKGNNINADNKVKYKEAIIIEQQLNEIKNFSDIAVKSDTTIIIKNSKNSNTDINNNSNNEKNSENSDIKENPISLTNFAKKKDPLSIKTIKSGSISNKDENNNNSKDDNNIINDENESEDKMDKNNINIKKIKQLKDFKTIIESEESNFHSLATMKRSDNSNENFSLSNSNELYQDIDYMSEEDLPKEIHNHSFKKKLLNNDLCIICSEKKYFVRGCKCDTCSFILCDICTSLILSGYYSNDRHRHPLVLMEKDNNTKCNICNLNIKNFCFHCEECNFTNCINCYIPKINEKIKEKKTEEETEKQNLFHEHNITFSKVVNCIICKYESNQGYLCEECDFKICFICLNKIFYKIKSLKFHQHQLKVRLKYDTICEICNCDLISKVSLFCKKCKKSFCLKCFNKK